TATIIWTRRVGLLSAAALTAALAATLLAVPAFAQPPSYSAAGSSSVSAIAPAANESAAAPAGIGNGVFTTINTASLFQCPVAVIGHPELSCNQGMVVNGTPSGHPDDVVAICLIGQTSPWGHPWTLVLNHANDQVGFIDFGFLVSQDGSELQ